MSAETPPSLREQLLRAAIEMVRAEGVDAISVREAVLLAYVTPDHARAREALELTARALGIPADALAERSAFGSAEEVAQRLHEYVAAGCTKYVLWPVGTAQDLIPQIESYGREILPLM